MLSHTCFQEFLDDISDCFVDEDFEKWKSRIELPLSMVTNAGTITIRDHVGLRQNFDHHLTACKVMNIDAIVRKPLNIERCAQGELLGTYETELLSHEHRATCPYQSSALLTWTGESLKMSSIMGARGHHSWTGVHPSIEDAGYDPRSEVGQFASGIGFKIAS